MHEPTPRQLEVFRKYIENGTQAEAAAELGISPKTVKATLSNLYSKLGTYNAIEAAKALGWLKLPE